MLFRSLLLVAMLTGLPCNSTAIFGIYDGPSFRWKIDNPQLQEIVEDLRASEATALENVRRSFEIPTDIWNQSLQEFKETHTNDLLALSIISSLPSSIFAKKYCPAVPPLARQSFHKNLALFGIHSSKIWLIADNYNEYPNIIAETDHFGFALNAQHPAWQNPKMTEFVAAHEIGHFIEGHAKRLDLIQECIKKHRGQVCDLNHWAILELCACQEMIADLILAIHNPHIAVEIDTLCSEQIMAESFPRSKEYMPWTTLQGYTQKIIECHKKNINKHFYVTEKIIVLKKKCALACQCAKEVLHYYLANK